MAVVLAAPYEPPGVPRTDWIGLSAMTWTGWDGSEWDLTGNIGGVSMQSGVRGLAMPEVRRWTSHSPAVAGSRWRGGVADERDVFWPLRIFSDAGSQEWLDYDRAFWRTMHPDRLGVWEVVQPSGEARALSLRFADDGSHSFSILPSLLGWAKYGVTLVAEQPYWQGRLESRTWKVEVAPPAFFGSSAAVAATLQVAADTVTRTAHGLAAGQRVRFSNIAGTTGLTAGVDYYVAGTVAANTFQVSTTNGGAVVDLAGADGTADYSKVGAPAFNVGSASSLADAKLSNPGDVDTWVKWIITGPTTTVTVGIEGRTIEVPFALASGETLTIDSAPTAQTATMGDGTDRTGSLGAVDFAPLPPGDAVPLTLTMAGSGQITATYQPQYLRAW